MSAKSSSKKSTPVAKPVKETKATKEAKTNSSKSVPKKIKEVKVEEEVEEVKKPSKPKKGSNTKTKVTKEKTKKEKVKPDTPEKIEQKFKDEIEKIEKILKEVCEKQKFDSSFTITNQGKTYDIGNDSKILSKIYELIIISTLKELLEKHKLPYLENEVQNKYPDFIICSSVDKQKFYAVDIKSSYIIKENLIGGFTLGTYKGYFQERKSLKSIVKPYESFKKHYCMCVIYEREDDKTPVRNFFFKEKWQLATNIAGSGNTCNIGSEKHINKLTNSELSHFKSEKEFDDFWKDK
jgi:hypothetical protein